MKTNALILALLLTVVSPALSQEAEAPAGAVSDTVDVTVVNVEVWVTDKKGNPVTDLSKEDFALRVDGKDVPITNFYSEGGASSGTAAASGEDTGRDSAPSELQALENPDAQQMRLVVFVDNTHIRPPNRKKVFNALRTFLDANLAPGDAVMIAGLSPTLRIYSDFVSDRAAIYQMLDDVENTAGNDFSGEFERRRVLSELTRMETTASRNNSVNPAVNAPALLATIRAYAQQQFDKGRQSIRVMTAFAETLAGVPGRKALIVVSDGIATNPGEELFTSWQENFAFNDALGTTAVPESDYQTEVGSFDLLPNFREFGRRANSAQVTVYPIDAEGDGPQRLRGASLEGELSSTVLSIAENNYREPMELVAQRTGGRRLQGRPQLARQLDLLAQDFDSFYSLGFASTTSSDKPQPIKVTVPGRKGVKVRHRQDVLPRNLDTRSADTTFAALLFNETPNPLGLNLDKGEAQKREDGKTVVPVDISIPVGRLEFVPTEGTHNAQLSIFISVRAKDGSTRPVQKVPFHLAIPDAHIEEAKGHPARYTLPLLVEEGDQQLAVTVRDDFGARESVVRIDLAL